MQKLAVRVREAASLIGLKEPTVRAYIRKGKIRAVKVGRAVLVPVSELERLVREGVPPQEDAEPVEATECKA